MQPHGASHPSDVHRLGPPDAAVTLLEYFDFQCPYCARAESPLRDTLDRFEGQAALVVRHFPLTQIHNWAGPAAVASEAASNQGQFWEMHDRLFARQSELGMSTIWDIAQELGLDQAQFLADFQSQKVFNRVNRDIAEGQRAGVDGTPTVFINGMVLNGEVSHESLGEAVWAVLRSRAA
ncbi:MAG TPA: DsbA family protein [Nitrospira sp.]|nr:DsbA family protein [Nitrospira sp.]